MAPIASVGGGPVRVGIIAGHHNSSVSIAMEELRDMTGDPGRPVVEGPPPRPPPASISRSARRGGGEPREMKRRRAKKVRKSGLSADRDAAHFADRLCPRVLCDRSWAFALIGTSGGWSLPAVGDTRPSWCRLARQTSTKFRTEEVRGWTSPISPRGRGLAPLRGVHDVDRQWHTDMMRMDRPRRAAHEGPAPKRIITGFGFWIFLTQRHSDVFVPLRALPFCRGRRGRHGL